MAKWVTVALRFILVCGLAGSLFVQFFMVPVFGQDLEEASAGSALRWTLLVLVVLGIASVQVVMVCVWRLLTMVTRGTMFSSAAFRWVDVIVGSVLVAALACFATGVVLAPTGVPPGIILLVGGAGGLVLGVALVVLVLRALLAQAVALDAEAAGLKEELGGVI